MKSTDFGAGFGGRPPDEQIPGLGMPQPTELIRVPPEVRAGAVVLDSAPESLSLGFRLSRALEAARRWCDAQLTVASAHFARAVHEAEAEAEASVGSRADSAEAEIPHEPPTLLRIRTFEPGPLPPALEGSLEPGAVVVGFTCSTEAVRGDFAPSAASGGGLDGPEAIAGEIDGDAFATLNQRALRAAAQALRVLQDRARRELELRGPVALRALARASVWTRRRAVLGLQLLAARIARAKAALSRRLGGPTGVSAKLAVDAALRVSADEAGLCAKQLIAGSAITIFPGVAERPGWVIAVSDAGEVGYVPRGAVVEVQSRGLGKGDVGEHA